MNWSYFESLAVLIDTHLVVYHVPVLTNTEYGSVSFLLLADKSLLVVLLFETSYKYARVWSLLILVRICLSKGRND